MTVECSRARGGATRVLHATVWALVAAIGLFSGGCGNSTITYGTPVITVSATRGSFTSYLVYITDVTLTRTDGVVVEPFAIQQQVDFTKLTNLTEIYGAPAVPEGTYTSGTITVNYSAAQIFVSVGGQEKSATVVDDTGAAVTTVTYNLTFDTAHPLVLKNGTSTPFDVNFDLSASSVITPTSSTAVQVAVKPFVTVSTLPTYTNPFRARGLFVVADTNSSGFTMNMRPFYDEISALGAITVNTNAQTTYNIDGVSYLGNAGLTALEDLPVSTVIAAYGTLGSLNSITPSFNATQVYAGTSLENLSETRVKGTVGARSGNTLTIHGATIFNEVGATALGPLTYQNSIPVTVSSNTIVSVDGEPNATGVSAQSISVGQQVDIGGNLTTDSSGNPLSLDATAGLVRLTQTSAWGRLYEGSAAGAAALELVTLGDFVPAAFNFAGTGSSASLQSDPAHYVLNTGSVDASGNPAGTLLRADGLVAAFGAAPPDFIASALTPGDQTEQLLVVQWVSGGATAPFLSATGSGLVVNMANSHLGPAHYVETGPTSIDLANPLVNATIVPDTTRTNQLAIGNPTVGLFMFNSYSSFLSKVTSTLNGTNALQMLVAVGRYDEATGVFTAYRIDLAQQ